MELRGKQKQYLKKEAHHMNPLFQVGKGGLNEEMLYQIGEALEKRELLKIALLQNTDEETDAVAAVIEEKLRATVVQQIGRTLVLFKPSSKEKNRHYSTVVEKI
ncbi:MAG: RNA-binding protein [Trichococcus sp.]|jgi:RNA-binding protein|nr:RNA-binding protein [Trichococcus sp.]